MTMPTGAYSSQGSQMRGPNGKIGSKMPSGYKTGQIQNYTPDQLNLMGNMQDQVGPDSWLSKLAGGDQSMFAEMEAPAYRDFNQNVGQMASRFSGMGQGARRSSGFQNMASQASSNFAQDLQSQRLNMRQQALKELMGMSSDLLDKKPYETFGVKKQQKEPFWKKILGIVSPAAGDIASGGTENTQNFFNALSGFTSGGGGGKPFQSQSANNSLDYANSFMPRR